MEKINFYQPKNQFPRAEIRFLLKMLLLTKFKVFNRALNKIVLFLLDRKFVSISWNEEFVQKKNISLGRNCFHCLEYLKNEKKNSFPIFHSGQRKRVFCLLETVLLYSEFFLLVENSIETWVSQFLKTKYVFASEHQFFNFFRDVKIF